MEDELEGDVPDNVRERGERLEVLPREKGRDLASDLGREALEGKLDTKVAVPSAVSKHGKRLATDTLVDEIEVRRTAYLI